MRWLAILLSSAKTPRQVFADQYIMSTPRLDRPIYRVRQKTRSTLKRCRVSNFYRVMLCIRGTSHGPVSVRPSQIGVLLKLLNESSWFLACELPSSRHIHCVKGKFGYLQNKGTSLWNFVLNFGLRKFRHGCISIVETCYQLSSRKVDALSVINWAVVGQLSR